MIYSEVQVQLWTSSVFAVCNSKQVNKAYEIGEDYKELRGDFLLVSMKKDVTYHSIGFELPLEEVCLSMNLHQHRGCFLEIQGVE